MKENKSKTAQELITSLEKDKEDSQLKKNKFSNLGKTNEEEEYLENLFRNRLKEMPSISSHELSRLASITDEKAKEIFEKLKAESVPKKEEEQKKEIKKNKLSLKKLKGKFNTLMDSSDRSAIKLFFFDLAIQGTFLNYVALVIFNQGFTYYSWIGWGLLAWFIERRFPPIIRSLWIK